MRYSVSQHRTRRLADEPQGRENCHPTSYGTFYNPRRTRQVRVALESAPGAVCRAPGAGQKDPSAGIPRMNGRSGHPEGRVATEPGVLQRRYGRDEDWSLADCLPIAAQARARATSLRRDTRLPPTVGSTRSGANPQYRAGGMSGNGGSDRTGFPRARGCSDPWRRGIIVVGFGRLANRGIAPGCLSAA